MSDTPTSPLSAANRWLVIFLLMGFAALGHFNRIGIGVAGTEVFIRPTVTESPSPAITETSQAEPVQRSTRFSPRQKWGLSTPHFWWSTLVPCCREAG